MEGTTSREGAPAPCHRILAAVDFSETSARGLELADGMARAMGVPLTVCHVLPRYVNTSPLVPHYAITPDREEERRTEAEALFRLAEWVAARIGSAAGDADVRVCAGDPATEIVSLAEDCGADLVVVASRGRGGIARMLVGSVAESVVRHAHCPVLVVR